jgi:hypothetical protein
MHRLLPILSLSALTLLACQKESKPDEPVAAAAPAVTSAKVSIASVTMLEDCPDPEKDPPEAKASAEAEMEDMVEGDSDRSYDPPCVQSTMQLAITGQGDGAAKLVVKEVRLLGPKGDALETIQTRMPTVWQEGGYASWDEMVPAKTDIKASYKLSPPNWNETEKKLGGSSYGPAFLLEADIEVGGVVQTMQSGQVVREPVEMIET